MQISETFSKHSFNIPSHVSAFCCIWLSVLCSGVLKPRRSS